MEFHGVLKKMYDCVPQYQGMRLWGWGMAVQFRVLIVSTSDLRLVHRSHHYL